MKDIKIQHLWLQQNSQHYLWKQMEIPTVLFSLSLNHNGNKKEEKEKCTKVWRKISYSKFICDTILVAFVVAMMVLHFQSLLVS